MGNATTPATTGSRTGGRSTSAGSPPTCSRSRPRSVIPEIIAPYFSGIAMNPDLLWVLGLLAGAITLFVIGKPRMDVVAVMLILALPLTGVLSIQQTLAGFSDPSVILIAALFVIGNGLV